MALAHVLAPWEPGLLSKAGIFAVQHLRIRGNWLNYMQLGSDA
jgi:hypothetical protein